MNTPSNFNPYYSNYEITLPPPTSSSAVASASVLKNARNTRINNSSFRITTHTTHTTNFNAASGASSGSSIDLLYKNVAPNAILNTGGRADEVRCHPGTREEVISLVEKSMDAQHYRGPRLLWLSGPAGAGKTAIMQTVAERCRERRVPHANFFFFRADASRCTAASLVATLIHQIIQFYPSARNAVAAALASNPLLFQMGLQEQFDTLMHLPFTVVQDSSAIQRPTVLLIDGLDECDSESKTAQGQILRALDTLLTWKGDSFRVVVASRVEPQLAMAFKQLRSQVDSIFLDERYSPETDIRLFVTAAFYKIKATHCLAHTLGEDWPSHADVNGIVAKSSGQFIYAATVMRFIVHSSSSPRLSLQKVQGIVPPAKNTPFAHLDAVYSYILSQVDDQDAVKSVLASKLLAMELRSIKKCLKAYHPRYSDELVDSCIVELTPLVRRDYYDRLLFFHASFTDFLQDKSRAREFYIDVGAFCAAVVPKVWTAGPIGSRGAHTDARIGAILALRGVQRPNPEITASLMNTDLLQFDDLQFQSRAKDLVKDLHSLYAPHDAQSFIMIMQKWTACHERLANMYPQYLPEPTTSQTVLQMLDLGAQTAPCAQTIPDTQMLPLAQTVRDFQSVSLTRTIPQATIVPSPKRGMMFFIKKLFEVRGTDGW